MPERFHARVSLVATPEDEARLRRVLGEVEVALAKKRHGLLGRKALDDLRELAAAVRAVLGPDDA